jgi:tetratricopeptide (TPR) repeat protein
MHCDRATIRLRIDAGTTHTLALAGQGSSYLELSEYGRDIAWRLEGDDGFTALSLRPPRLGTAVLPLPGGRNVQLQLAPGNDRAGLVDVTLHCAETEPVAALASCLRQVGVWPGWSAFQALWSQPSALCSAFAVHESAARASERADYRAAIALYSHAAQRWRGLDDPAREAAALLGLSERLADAGQYAQATAAVAQAVAAGKRAGLGYYAIRAEATRCLYLDDMGQLEEATTCMMPIPEAYLRLGETSEAVNAWLNLAAFHLDRGDVTAARQRLSQARSRAASVSDRIRARVHLMNARVSAAEGSFQSALAAVQASLDTVERTGDQRWHANMLLEAANLYQRLAAPLESRVLAEHAHEAYVGLGAPERRAAAKVLLARLNLDEGDRTAAIAAADAAADLYRQSGLSAEELGALIIAARAGSGAAWSGIDRLKAAGQVLHPWQQLQIEITRIEQALDSATPMQATAHARRLGTLAAQVDGAEEWLHLHRLKARALLAAQLPDQAMAVVESALARHRVLVEAARLPSLRQMLLRQARPLASAWVDAVLALPLTQQPDPARVRERLRWLHAPDLLRPRPDDLRSGDGELEKDLQSLLLTGDHNRRLRLRAQRSLLALHAGESDVPTLVPAAPLVIEPAAPTPTGVMRLSYGFGAQGALVVVERDGALEVLRLGNVPAVIEQVQRLVRQVMRRDSAVAEIGATAGALAALILPAQLGAAPAQLWVDWDPILAPVPFALLPWPGTDGPMVDATAVSRRLGVASALVAPARVDLLVAARPAGLDSTDLPYLLVAEAEPGLVAGALRGVPVREHAGREGGRAHLRSLLTEPGTWLHVAAHGVSRTGIQGLAGLWLAAPEDADVPEFVSWLGLADTALSADLVVLNACQLADSDLAANAAIGFATALAAAGVDHVVAANWQLSDSASAVWVPVFYRSLTGSPSGDVADPVRALREAQLALRRSRAFRHPFYWAGLGHLQGLP